MVVAWMEREVSIAASLMQPPPHPAHYDLSSRP